MMEKNERSVEIYLWRGGKKLSLNKVEDSFTVRMRRGVKPSKVATSYRTSHRGTIFRQNLEEFTVDKSERDSTMARVREGKEVEFASHVYSFESEPNSNIFLTDEITVQFKPQVSDAEVERLVVELGLELVKELQGVARAYVFRVTSKAKENPIKIANRLMSTDKVLVSEPNITVTAQRRYVPTDPLFAQQWHLYNSGGIFLSPLSHIDAVNAWNVTRGDRSIIVAVADDSVDTRHEDFQGPGKIVAPRDFKGLDFEPLPEGEDDKHGTSCAGVAVAEENGQGVVGVAPGCALMPIRMTGWLDDNSIEELFDWIVQHGAGVISCSWGPSVRYFPLSFRQSNALHRAATLGRNGRGCLIVFAAGNNNRPLNGTLNETGWPNNDPSGPTPWLDGYVTHPDVVAVAACTSEAKKSAYSNWGSEISVCAPSNNAPPSTYPTINASTPGRGILTTDRIGSSGYSTSDYTYSFGGTSSACPTVAGVAALILSSNTQLTSREVRAILETTADKIVDNDPDPQLGQSLGNYNSNGHSQWFGYGKVNALKAVTEAVRRKNGSVAQGGGCFIATAAFGSELDPHVQFLRNFRDNVVLQSWLKLQFQKFENLYYQFSPPIAKQMEQHVLFRNLVKFSIVYPFVVSAKVLVLTTLAVQRIKELLNFQRSRWLH